MAKPSVVTWSFISILGEGHRLIIICTISRASLYSNAATGKLTMRIFFTIDSSKPKTDTYEILYEYVRMDRGAREITTTQLLQSIKNISIDSL